MRSARRNPPLALALNGLAVRSQQWMLTAAGIGASGPRGMMRAPGLAVLFGSVLRTWIARRRSGTGADHGGARSRAGARSALLSACLTILCAYPVAPGPAAAGAGDGGVRMPKTRPPRSYAVDRHGGLRVKLKSLQRSDFPVAMAFTRL